MTYLQCFNHFYFNLIYLYINRGMESKKEKNERGENAGNWKQGIKYMNYMFYFWGSLSFKLEL